MLQLKQKLFNHLNRSVMVCAEANNVDLVEYLFSLGFTPTKTRGNDYWYLSPLRDEKEASFKINKSKNVWFDQGAGKGGNVVDFITSYFNCDVSTALQKLSSVNYITQKQFNPIQTPDLTISSEISQPELFNEYVNPKQQLGNVNDTVTQHEERPPFHLHENSMINYRDAAETAIEIIAAKKPITNHMLCRYLIHRRVNKNIADSFCYEVTFKFSNKDTQHTAIGFKNSAGGYELRNSFFKLSSSPKYITYINTDEQNSDTKTEIKKNVFNVSTYLKSEEKNGDKNLSNQSSIVSQNDALKGNLKCDFKNEFEDQNQALIQSKNIGVFEGFFDFLSYQTIHQNQTQSLTNFLVLNSLSFFERSLLLMEKHEHIHLYLDHDEAGRKCLDIALKRSPQYKDESGLYKGYKDLNDFVMHFGKLQRKQSLKVSNKNRLI